jgi:hypothetical protein
MYLRQLPILQSGWGIFNVPLVLTQIYPFYNMAGAHLSPLSLRLAGGVGVYFPKTFVASPLQRVASIGIGMSHQFGSKDFGMALVPVAERGNDAFALLREEGRLDDVQLSVSSSTSPRYLLDLHMGNGLFLENTFTVGTSTARYSATDRRTGDRVVVDGTMRLSQLTGGLRRPLPWIRSPNQELFGRLGSGWAWYTLRDVKVDGTSLTQGKGGYAPTLLPSRRSWPNFLYTGMAYEYFSPRSQWIGQRLGYGFRVDATWIVQRLPAGEIGARRDVWAPRGDLAFKATVGW